MLLNQNSIGREKGGRLQNIANDPFDRPIPGQSLTGPVGKWPWENPPQITDVDDALMAVMQQLRNSKRTQKSYDQLMTLGMPIESIVNTITFGGFINGLWSVDTAELLKPPLEAALMLYADEKQLPYKIFNSESDMNKTPEDELSTYDAALIMKENNRNAFDKMIAALEMSAEGVMLKSAENKEIADSFLVVSPETEEVEDV